MNRILRYFHNRAIARTQERIAFLDAKIEALEVFDTVPVHTYARAWAELAAMRVRLQRLQQSP